MTDRASESKEGPAFHAELSAFAAELTELWLACGKPAIRNVLEKQTGVSGSTISEAFTGKRLPKREPYPHRPGNARARKRPTRSSG